MHLCPDIMGGIYTFYDNDPEASLPSPGCNSTLETETFSALQLILHEVMHAIDGEGMFTLLRL